VFQVFNKDGFVRQQCVSRLGVAIARDSGLSHPDIVLPSAARHQNQWFADSRLMQDLGILNAENLAHKIHREVQKAVYIPAEQSALSQFRYHPPL
jgi:hypothetical protein